MSDNGRNWYAGPKNRILNEEGNTRHRVIEWNGRGYEDQEE